MPQVIGAVTHTKVKCHRLNSNDVRTKTDDTLHVQIVTDADLKIRDLDCRFQTHGNVSSTADIFLNSRIKERFEQNEFRGRLLLGDSSLKCSSYLYTPVNRAITLAEQKFNNSQRLTYEPARLCLKLWHQRFSILDKELCGSHTTNRNIIVALVLLHNMAVEWKDTSLGKLITRKLIKVLIIKEKYFYFLVDCNKLKTYCHPTVTEISKCSDERGRSEFIKNHFNSSIH